MPKTAPVPTNAELEILRILWKRGPATVREVHDALKRDRDIGYTTVLKTMQVMAEKRIVSRDESERSHVYSAAIEERSVMRKLVADLVDRAFDGSAAGLVMHALSHERTSREDVKKIKDLLDEHSRKSR